ncbi:MAG: ribosome silencing factor [Firmicutes bacterium]|nr:ribosome silencing factor [Bacillota bacterium]
MTSRESALLMAQVLDEKKTTNIDIIDIAEKSGFADFFVIGTARNLRQLGSLADELEDKMAENGVFADQVEGKSSGWVLIDFGDIVVNLFTAEEREHYQIERVWNDCIRIDFEPAPKED